MIVIHHSIQPGDLLARPSDTPGITHYGTAVGAHWVAHTMPGRGKHISSLEEFAATQIVNVTRYPYSHYQRSSIVTRACRDLGRPYDALTANCEHDVSRTHGNQPVSPTVDSVFFVLAAAILINSLD